MNTATQTARTAVTKSRRPALNRNRWPMPLILPAPGYDGGMDFFVEFVVAPAIAAVIFAPLVISIIKFARRGSGPPIPRAPDPPPARSVSSAGGGWGYFASRRSK